LLYVHLGSINDLNLNLSFVVFQNTNFVVDILDSLFKTGKLGTQWYCVIPGTFSVPWKNRY